MRKFFSIIKDKIDEIRTFNHIKSGLIYVTFMSAIIYFFIVDYFTLPVWAVPYFSDFIATFKTVLATRIMYNALFSSSRTII